MIHSSIIPIALLLGSISATELDRNEISSQRIDEQLSENLIFLVDESMKAGIQQSVNASDPVEEVEEEVQVQDVPRVELAERDFESRGLVFESGGLIIYRELINSQIERDVKAQLNDMDFVDIPEILSLFNGVHTKTSGWETSCLKDGKIRRLSCGPFDLAGEMLLDQGQVETLLGILNPDAGIAKRGIPADEEQVRYESVILLHGQLYAIQISEKWITPN